MIINITLKDPDGVYDAIQDAAENSLQLAEDLDQDVAESLLQNSANKIEESLEPWIECCEYVRLQIDTEAKTATVLLNK